MEDSREEAYCTLLMSDSYLPGAMVLARSLRDNRTRKKLAVLVTLGSLAAATIDELRTIYDYVIDVPRVINKTPANLYLMNRPDLVSTFTKIELWRQTQFRRIVYVDSDVVALRAPDELFRVQSAFAAAPDVGWPDCFNSGVMSLVPNMGEYYSLRAMADRGISFDGADQGLLNMHFTSWERMSFTYNCTPSAHYQYVPAYRHFQSQISMIHFIGDSKPWRIGREYGGSGGAYSELLGRWWAVYDRHYRAPTAAYISGQTRQPPRTVQQYVKGDEHESADYGYSSIPPPPQVQMHEPDSQQASHHDGQYQEQPRQESEPFQQHHHPPPPPQPAPVQHKPFIPPQVDWNPAREPPPRDSQPEAANFPETIYSMSADPKPYQAPKSFPKPPRDMYYEVPETPRTPAEERPAPIFPWEIDQAPATRVFADDYAPPSPPFLPSTAAEEQRSEPTSADETQADLENAIERTDFASQETSNTSATAPVSFAEFRRTNAWDEIPGIERYVTAFQSSRRGGRRSGQHSPKPSANNVAVASPQPRKPSMRLTDFPTEFERPSLPVTPMPRRPSFWGEERDAEGELPPAEGVPDAVDWDPSLRLEELQRMQAETMLSGSIGQPKEIPLREQLESAALVPTSEETEYPQTSEVRGRTASRGEFTSEATTMMQARADGGEAATMTNVSGAEPTATAATAGAKQAEEAVASEPVT